MEKYIKTKIELKLMKRLIVIMTIFFISILSVNSAVKYPIDEGFGAIIFDTKNTGFTGVGIPAKNVFWSPLSKNGLYSVYPKAGKTINILINNYPQLTPITNNYTIEFQYQPSTTLLENVFSKLGTYTFDYNGATNTGSFTYYTGLIPHIVPINNISSGQINSLYLTRNLTHYIIFSNNITQGVFIDPLPLDVNINPLNLFMNSYTGLIDKFEIYDRAFLLTDINQIISQQQTNTTTPTTNNPTTIISTQNPQNNDILTPSIKFDGTLLQQANCELYIDNQFETEFLNTLAFTYTKDFSNNLGLHNYFLYCYKNNLTELSPIINFNVSPLGTNTINFNIAGTDFNVNNVPLEIVTPCLKKGMTFGGALDPYRPLYNTGGAQFKDVVNGHASLNVPVGTHEFCLIHGLVSYDSYNKTTNYNPNIIYSQLELGNYDIPNNLTTSYNIAVDNFDIYNYDNPKAWGTSWVGIITSLIAFAIGLFVLMAGVSVGSGQAVIIGGLMILFSLGYQLSNIVLGVLF